MYFFWIVYPSYLGKMIPIWRAGISQEWPTRHLQHVSFLATSEDFLHNQIWQSMLLNVWCFLATSLPRDLFGQRALGWGSEPADDGRKTYFSTWHVLEREVGINVENTDERWTKTWLFRVLLGDEMLPSLVGIVYFINHYKDPVIKQLLKHIRPMYDI